MTIYNPSTHQAPFATSSSSLEYIAATDKLLIDLNAAGLIDLTATTNGGTAPSDKNKLWLEASATAGLPGTLKEWSDSGQAWVVADKNALFRHIGGTIDVKASVRVASTANVTISGPGAAIDGVTLAAGNRVLLKNQTTASENGIYVWTGAATAMTRALDSDGNPEVTEGLQVFVAEGTAGGQKTFKLDTVGSIAVGTTSLAFSQYVPTTLSIGQGSIA
jgi:hypothetical protein